MGTIWIFIGVLLLRFIEANTTVTKPQGQWQWLDCSQHCASCVDVKPDTCKENETFYYDGDPCGCCDACIAMSDVGEPCLHAMSLQKTSTQSRVVVSTKVCREGLICSRGLCIARQKTPCNTENRGLSYVSRCDHHGFYMPFQCSSSHCWCVNRFSGKSIPDSKRLWDFYWINLDAKFGCPPQKDLNNLIDSEEDENSSRWRRSVDDLYFPGYQNSDGTFKPVKELKELYSNLVQLKVALNQLSKDDVLLIKSLIKTDIMCKHNKMLNENVERNDNQLSKTFQESEPDVQLIRKVKRHLLENYEPGKVVLEMEIDCPDQTTTTTTAATTTVETIIQESSTSVNETKKSKGKRKLKRKKTRVTRAIINQEESTIKVMFQKFWDHVTLFTQLMYQSMIKFFTRQHIQNVQNNTDNSNISEKHEEVNLNQTELSNVSNEEDKTREDIMYDENFVYHPIGGKMNFDCRNLNKEECERQMDQLFQSQKMLVMNRKKRSLFYYYHPFLRISSSESSESNKKNTAGNKRKGNKRLRFSEEMMNYSPISHELLLNSNSIEKINSMELSQEKKKFNVFNSFENFNDENNNNNKTFLNSNEQTIMTDDDNNNNWEEIFYKTSTTDVDDDLIFDDARMMMMNSSSSSSSIEITDKSTNFEQMLENNITIHSKEEMLLLLSKSNSDSNIDESKEKILTVKLATKTSVTSINSDEVHLTDHADSEEEEEELNSSHGIFEKLLLRTSKENAKLSIFYKIKETLGKNDTDNQDDI